MSFKTYQMQETAGCVCVFVIAILLLSLPDPANADEVNLDKSSVPGQHAGPPKPHMIDFARKLLGQLGPEDFGDPETAKLLQGIIQKSRLKSWAGAQLDVEDPTEELGAEFDLYTQNSEEHREAVEKLLSASTQAERRQAAREILVLNGKLSPEQKGNEKEQELVRSAVKRLGQKLAQQFETRQRNTNLEAGEDASRLDITWDQEEGDFLISVNPANSDTQYVIQGGIVIERNEDGVMEMRPVLDDHAIRIIDAQKRNEISQSLFGKWVNDNGDIWSIGTPGAEPAPAEEKTAGKAADNQKTLVELRAELKATRAKKVYIWINEETGENIIQEHYKRLKEPFVFMKQESDSFYKDKISKLEETINKLENSGEVLPVDQHDPLKIDQDANQTPGTIMVKRDDGYSYQYADVFYDGKRLTARRTLSDLNDILSGALPEHIRRELIGNWSPPEWIELNTTYRPRTDDVVLKGNLWRLHVTYSGISNQVTKIHDPYVEKKIFLTKVTDVEPKPVSLRFLAGPAGPALASPDRLSYGKPVFVELVFDRPSEQQTHLVSLKHGKALNKDIEVFQDAGNAARFLSRQIVLTHEESK